MMTSSFVFMICVVASPGTHALKRVVKAEKDKETQGKQKVLEQWLRDSECLEIEAGSRTLNLKDKSHVQEFLSKFLQVPTKLHEESHVAHEAHKEKFITHGGQKTHTGHIGAPNGKEEDFIVYLDVVPAGPQCCEMAAFSCWWGCFYHEHGNVVDEFFSREHHEDDWTHCMNEAVYHCDDAIGCTDMFCLTNQTMWESSEYSPLLGVAEMMGYEAPPRDPDSPKYTQSPGFEMKLGQCIEKPTMTVFSPKVIKMLLPAESVNMTMPLLSTLQKTEQKQKTQQVRKSQQLQKTQQCSRVLQFTHPTAKASVPRSPIAGISEIVSLELPDMSRMTTSAAISGLLQKLLPKLLDQPLQLLQTAAKVKHYTVTSTKKVTLSDGKLA